VTRDSGQTEAPRCGGTRKRKYLPLTETVPGGGGAMTSRRRRDRGVEKLILVEELEGRCWGAA